MSFGRIDSTAAATAVPALASILLLGAPLPAPAQHPPAVRGLVVDATTAFPVSGARIRMVDGAAEASTSEEGRFVLQGLASGRHLLRIEALGYDERGIRIHAENGRVEELRIELRPRPLTIAGVDVVSGGRGAPADARVLERAEIEAATGATLDELLDALPGVTVLRRGSGGSATATIRGSDPDEVLVLFDGAPLNSPVTGEADLSTLPLSAVERVVVLPGARSARYGPRAAAGVILVEPRRFRESELTARSSVGSRGRWSFGATTGGSVLSEGRTRWSGGASAQWRSSRGDFVHPVPDVRGGGSGRRSNADHADLGITGHGELELGSLTIRTHLHAHRDARGVPGSVVRPSPEARRRQDRLVGHGSVAGPSGSWEVRLHGRREHASFRDPAPPAGPAYDESTRFRSMGGSAAYRVGSGGLRLELGGEARHDRISSTMLSSDAPERRQSAGLWASGRWEVRPGDLAAVAVAPALRADWSSLDPNPVLSPRVTATLSRGYVSLRLSAGRAFAPPSLADQYFQEGVLVRPNPSLDGERVRGEVEGTVELGDRRIGPLALDLRVSGFRSDVDGRILWIPDHRFVWSPENFDVTRRGWEGEVEARWAGTGIRVSGSGSRALVRYRGPVLEGPVAYRPTWTGRVGAVVPVGPVRVEGDARYVGRRRTVPGSTLNTLESYWRTDVAVRSAFSVGGWRVEPALRVENVRDRPAAMFPDHPLPGRGWRFQVQVRPTGGRTTPGDHSSDSERTVQP